MLLKNLKLHESYSLFYCKHIKAWYKLVSKQATNWRITAINSKHIRALIKYIKTKALLKSISSGCNKPHTRGYFLAASKPVDLCTLSYHQGAHMPSTGFGPSSHLNYVMKWNEIWYKRGCSPKVSLKEHNFKRSNVIKIYLGIEFVQHNCLLLFYIKQHGLSMLINLALTSVL